MNCQTCGKEIEHGPDASVTVSIDPLVVVHPNCLPADAIPPTEFGNFDVRDNRAKFKKKPESEEFPEFTSDEDWFEAHSTIEI